MSTAASSPGPATVRYAFVEQFVEIGAVVGIGPPSSRTVRRTAAK
jgi:hypothetical protein